MSISLYSGTPGSGKSLRATYKLIYWLNAGYDVIANFPIDLGYFRKKKIGKFNFVENQDLTVEYLIQYHNEHHKPGMKPQTLVVIDEAQCMFNCRQWENKDRNGWIKFFSMHRHLNYDIILISQSDRLLDRQIRAFIETEYRHRAMRNYKLFGRFLSFIFGGLFVSIEYWYGPNLRCGSDFFLLNRRKARVYDTMKLFDNLGGQIRDSVLLGTTDSNNHDSGNDTQEGQVNENTSKVETNDTVDKHESGTSATAVGASEAAEKAG